MNFTWIAQFDTKHERLCSGLLNMLSIILQQRSLDVVLDLITNAAGNTYVLFCHSLYLLTQACF